MLSISMVRGDDSTIIITPKNEDSVIFLGDDDKGIFVVYDCFFNTVMRKEFGSEAQNPEGGVCIEISAADTENYQGEEEAFPGSVIEMHWELELTISGNRITPAVAQPFFLTVDAIVHKDMGDENDY